MAQYCVSIFGDMLLDKPLDDFPVSSVQILYEEYSYLYRSGMALNEDRLKPPFGSRPMLGLRFDMGIGMGLGLGI